MGKKSRSGSEMNIPDHISESLDTFELAIVRNNATFFLPRDGSGSSEVKIITNSASTSIFDIFSCPVCSLIFCFLSCPCPFQIRQKLKIGEKFTRVAEKITWYTKFFHRVAFVILTPAQFKSSYNL
jgi:hypothetical protein